MSVPPYTRAAARSRWIRAAMAALMLASGTLLLAQEDKDKEKKAPPPPKKTNTPGKKENTPPPKQNPTPAVHPNNPPPKENPTPAARPNNPPPNNPPRPAVNNDPANRPRPEVAPNNNVRPAPTPMRNAPMGGNRPVYHGANGAEVHYGANGRPQTVVAHGYTISHGPGPVARAEFVRPDHSVIVTQGGHWGYVQRPFVFHNVSYAQRTYVVGGVSYARIYRPYVYGGISLNVYVSPRFYSPAFYGYAYSPWARPVVFSFGWGPQPWFGFYGGYFAPYPTYAGPAYYLTDYMMAMSLQDAYAQQQAAAAAQANAYSQPLGGQPALTPDVKQAIADEVHRQLDEERAESQAAGGTGAPEFLTDNTSHVFLVASGLNVQSSAGECGLTEGDVIQMSAPAPPNAAMTNLVVLASKGQDCRKGTSVSVAVADLMDMENHMRATLDQGLADLQSHQGSGGIPAEPPAAQTAPVPAPYAAAAPPPDPNIRSEVSQQAAAADQAEAEVLAQAQSGPSAGGPPPSITLGMTIDQVTGLMGQPQAVADLGQKKIYSYGSIKIIFMDGKVSDVQ